MSLNYAVRISYRKLQKIKYTRGFMNEAFRTFRELRTDSNEIMQTQLRTKSKRTTPTL